MIDWLELLKYNRFDYDVQHFIGHGDDGYYHPRSNIRHEKLEDWIARRINRRLAGYEAMKEYCLDRIAYCINADEDFVPFASVLVEAKNAEAAIDTDANK